MALAFLGIIYIKPCQVPNLPALQKQDVSECFKKQFAIDVSSGSAPNPKTSFQKKAIVQYMKKILEVDFISM